MTWQGRRSRWKRVVGGGALAATLVGSGSRVVRACDETYSTDPLYNDEFAPYPDGYIASPNVGIVVGVAFAPEIRFAYGLDVHVGKGTVAGFVRIEGRGVTAARMVAGANWVEGCSTGSMTGEAGVALHSHRRGSDIAPSFGLHLAGGVYGYGIGLLGQGMLPLVGDVRNYDLGTTLLLFPGEYGEVLSVGPSGGRRLRDGTQTVLPIVAALQGTAGRQAVLERAWIEDARAEQASVTAFVRMAAELRALGAPGALARGALASAGDEVRHTQLCTTLAGEGYRLLPLASRHETPRWRQPSTAALATTAREAWLDGCLGEGIAAGMASCAATRARDGVAATSQAIIATDERRHAELAWSVLEWLWREGGAAARDALVEATREPLAPLAEAPTDIDHDFLAEHGRADAEEARRVAERETACALERVQRLIG